MNSIELFAGCGGMGLGISRSGFSTNRVIEINSDCCATIRANKKKPLPHVAQWPLLQEDVRNVDFTKHERKVQLISGGPPCQPFSRGGLHGAETDPRNLFPEAVRAVREIKPHAFIFENVDGLARDQFARYFEYIRLQLRFPTIPARCGEDWRDHLARLQQEETGGRRDGLHYGVVADVLNAADYGLPQKRKRVFFVGFRADLGVEWSFPKPTHSREALAWSMRYGDYWERHRVPSRRREVPKNLRNVEIGRLDPPRSKPWRTVRDAIADLPDPFQEPDAASVYENHFFQPGARSYKGHTGSPKDEPAKTLKAGVHGVPGGENMLLHEDGNVRYFSVREAARLQGFPDAFRFEGAWSETMRQLGNAVPVTVAELLASDIRRRVASHACDEDSS